jgi:hypothetical protein
MIKKDKKPVQLIVLGCSQDNLDDYRKQRNILVDSEKPDLSPQDYFDKSRGIWDDMSDEEISVAKGQEWGQMCKFRINTKAWAFNKAGTHIVWYDCNVGMIHLLELENLGEHGEFCDASNACWSYTLQNGLKDLCFWNADTLIYADLKNNLNTLNYKTFEAKLMVKIKHQEIEELHDLGYEKIGYLCSTGTAHRFCIWDSSLNPPKAFMEIPEHGNNVRIVVYSKFENRVWFMYYDERESHLIFVDPGVKHKDKYLRIKDFAYSNCGRFLTSVDYKGAVYNWKLGCCHAEKKIVMQMSRPVKSIRYSEQQKDPKVAIFTDKDLMLFKFGAFLEGIPKRIPHIMNHANEGQFIDWIGNNGTHTSCVFRKPVNSIYKDGSETPTKDVENIGRRDGRGAQPKEELTIFKVDTNGIVTN